MDVFFSRWLLLGFSFGEAACAAQASISWQTTVVGDPLYRPFGKDPRALHEQLVARHSPWVEWSVLRWVDINLAAGAAPEGFVPFLQTNSAALQSAILTEKLAALYQAAGKPDLAVKALRQALALHPTPQTIVRLTLALGDLLASSGHEADALDLYEDFQINHRDYPDALPLWEKMRALAVKLDRKSQAARYEAEIKKLAPTLNP